MHRYYVFVLSVLFLTILVVINLNVITLQNNTVDTVYIRESSQRIAFLMNFTLWSVWEFRKLLKAPPKNCCVNGVLFILTFSKPFNFKQRACNPYLSNVTLHCSLTVLFNKSLCIISHFCVSPLTLRACVVLVAGHDGCGWDLAAVSGGGICLGTTGQQG